MSAELLPNREAAVERGNVAVLEQAQARLQERELRFRELLDALPAAIYVTDAAGRITFFNHACIAFSGRTPEIGADAWCVTWRLYYPDGTPLAHDQCPMAVALRENREVRGAEAIAERPDGTRVPFIPYPTPIRDADGRVIGAVNMLVDITHRKEAEERLKLLSNEVNHRANNLLAVVQAMVRMTEAPTVAEYKLALQGRIQALAHAHSLLAETRWQGADLQRLVTEELAPYVGAAEPRVWASGPPVPLDPNLAQSFALAIHELATNAAKHGAFSASDGTVHVDWRREPDGLVFRWTEAGGPAVAQPSRRGVGTRVMERAVQQLGARLSFDWRPQGLVCEIVTGR
jgi:PAS domain S-box-containing protein